MKISKVFLDQFEHAGYTSGSEHLLLDVHDDLFICWSRADGCLLAHVEGYDSIQSLVLPNPPMWDVKHVLINGTGKQVALVGYKGLLVITLPERYGSPPTFKGGSDAVTCRVHCLAERFYLRNPKVTIVSAVWHPGSIDQSHIVILSSDNSIRTFSLSSPEVPQQILLFGNASGQLASSVTCATAYSEKAVSFAFAPHLTPVEGKTGKGSRQRQSNLLDDPEGESLNYFRSRWPIFILFDTGDVYYAMTCLAMDGSQGSGVFGPLLMSPANEDNYGVEACALLVLPSSPPVIVVSNSDGRLHHCVVVESDDAMVSNGAISIGVTPSLRLHVYESVFLQLQPRVNEESLSCGINLHRDPNDISRYYVSHEDGVHCVTVSFVEHLQEYADTGEDAPFVADESASVIEHLVSTRTSMATNPWPLIGLSITSLPPVLHVLLGSGIIISIGVSVPHSIGLEKLVPQRQRESFFGHGSKASLEEHIRIILERCKSQPFLVSGSSEVVPAGEYSDRLMGSMNLVKEQYLEPQRRARNEIQNRVKILTAQKQRLTTELSRMNDDKKEFCENTQFLTKNYNEIYEKQIDLQNRLERVMSRVVRSLPELSAEETSMKQELEKMRTKLTSMKAEVTQAEKKQQNLSQMMSGRRTGNASEDKVAPMSEKQLLCLKEALNKEGEDLHKLVQKICDAKRTLQL